MTAKSLLAASRTGAAGAYVTSTDQVGRAAVADILQSDVSGREANANEHPVAASKLKRVLDVLIAAPAILFFAPLMALIYVLVRLDGGPGVFVQQRIGKGGRPFPCLKFRTMVPNAETALLRLIVDNEQHRRDWEAERKLRDDPRVTRIGQFLRRKSLDELPQLFNVLRGDMSLVGPRPINPDEREKYGEHFATYVCLRPGLTGLWQVSGRNDVCYDDRVAFDVEYARNWTFVADLKIIVRTFGAVYTERGAL